MMALSDATMEGDLAVVQLLLNCSGIDANAKDSGGMTALHWAVVHFHGNYSVWLDAQDSKGMPAPYHATMDPIPTSARKLDYENQTAVFKPLPNGLGLNAKLGDISALDNDAAIYHTAFEKILRSFKLLVNCDGVDVDAKDSQGNTARDIAALWGDPGFGAFLLNELPWPNED